MIDIGKYQIILDEGLLLDHYSLLLSIKEGRELVKSKRIQGFVNLMCKKGYIEEGILTDKAMKLLEGEHISLPEVVNPIAKKKVVFKPLEKFDYGDWVIQLHGKCEDKLIEATGKKQVRADVRGSFYSFLPNSTDLGKVILRAVKAYGLSDFNKIEHTILRYVNRCVKTNKWTPLLGYYIMKENLSSMVTDMDCDDDELSAEDLIVNI